MTVSAQETVFHHVGNGVSVTFAYGCQVQRAADLSVYVADVLTVAGFTVNGIGSPSGGSVTFAAAPASGTQIRLERIIVLERDTDYQQNGDFLARVVNPDFDRLWMALQQHASANDRAITIPAADSGINTTLALAALRANNLLGFDQYGNPVPVAPSPIGPSGPPGALELVAHKNFNYDYTDTTTIVYDGSIGDGLHRHFGQLAEGIDGRLHLVYGRSPTHGLTAGMTAWYRHSVDGGRTWSAEIEIIPADAALDQRSLSLCVTPSGRIILLYAAVPADSSVPVIFRNRYSVDNGATWQQGSDIASIPFTYARAYGRPKIIPGVGASSYRLAWTPYFRSGSGPATYRVAVFVSSDDGATWAEGTPIVNDTTGQTECELVAVNATVWFAVTRGGTGLTLYKTTDGGVSWVSLGVIPLTVSDSWVAPTIDKFEKDGSWFLALAYCNRATDELQWRVAAVAAAINSAAAFGSEIVLASDMVNASGYQCPITAPDGSLYVEGGTAYIEFKEYIGQVYTQVRFVRIDLLALIAKAATELTIDAGVLTVPGNSLERIITVRTEASAASDDVDTINGGRLGIPYVFQGSQGTSTQDPIFRNGTGNLDLIGDFRANTIDSRLVLVKTGLNWTEVGRSNDSTDSAMVIAAGVVGIPSSREVRYFIVDTEAAAAADDLATINGGLEGQVVILMTASSTRDVTVIEGGNIILDVAGPCVLDNLADTITLVRRSVSWYEVNRSNNT